MKLKVVFFLITLYIDLSQGCSFIIQKFKDDELCLGESWFDKQWGNCTEIDNNDPDKKVDTNLCSQNSEKTDITDVLGLNQPLDECIEDKHSPGNYGMITACNTKYFTWYDYGDDS